MIDRDLRRQQLTVRVPQLEPAEDGWEHTAYSANLAARLAPPARLALASSLLASVIRAPGFLATASASLESVVRLAVELLPDGSETYPELVPIRAALGDRTALERLEVAEDLLAELEANSEFIARASAEQLMTISYILDSFDDQRAHSTSTA